MKDTPQESPQPIGVDSDLILYRGTTASFMTFSDEYLQSLGFHFGCCEQAEYFARRHPGGRIISARLKAQNLVDLRGSDCGWLYSDETVVCLVGTGILEQAQAIELLGHCSRTHCRRTLSENQRRVLNQRIMALLADKGYDGVVYSNRWEPPDRIQRDAYVVFRADQIVPIKTVQVRPPNNPLAVIEPFKQTQDVLAKMLTLLEAVEGDKFAAHLYLSRRQYRRTCERAYKSNNAIRRTVLSTYQIAQSLGFNGDYRAWEHLLRIHE